MKPPRVLIFLLTAGLKFSRRRGTWLLCLPSLFAICLFFSPLLRDLDYEFAEALAIVGALLAPTLAYHQIRREAPRPLIVVFLSFAAPLVLALIFQLWRGTCGIATGVAFYGVVTLPSVLYGAIWGIGVAKLLSRQPPWLRHLGLCGITFVPLACCLYALYWQPPIFVYDHLFGYFAGSLYDEQIELTPALYALRVGTALRIGAGLWILRAYVPGRLPSLILPGLVLTFCAQAYEHYLGAFWGFRVDHAIVARSLPVIRTRPGLTIHLPKHIDPGLADRIADDHAFRRASIIHTWGLTDAAPLTSYVYATAEDKARLMGGRNTMFAKPWLHEIHVHGLSRANPLVAHELTHALLATYGSWPLQVTARYGVFAQMALIEGYAESTTPGTLPLTLHGRAAALRRLQRAPDLYRLLAEGGFYGQSASRAYLMTGSFLRYLRDQYGASRLLPLYRRGQFAETFDVPLRTLVEDYYVFLDAYPLSEKELHLADDWGRVPSIFERRCPHTVARLRGQVPDADAAHRQALYKTICRLESGSPYCLAERAIALWQVGEAADILTWRETIRDGEQMTRQTQSQLEIGAAQALLRQGELTRVATILSSIESLAASPADLRWGQAAKAVLSTPTATLGHALSVSTLAAGDLFALTLAARRESSTPALAGYLVGRYLLGQEAFAEAIEALSFSTEPLPPLLEAERWRMRGEALLFAGQYKEAQRCLEQARELAEYSRQRDSCDDLLARCAFYAAGPH